jgi:hypothetical protein
LAGESDLEKEDMNDLREYLRRWHWFLNLIKD